MNKVDISRRRSLLGAGAAASGLLLFSGSGCTRNMGEQARERLSAAGDLMREHGVLRRAVLVYRESASRLRAGQPIDTAALEKTAMLFRNFGEDYHERMLEETYVFPAVRRAGGTAAGFVDVLLAQHMRGREITDYILGVVSSGAIGAAYVEPLARAFDSFALMYANHAAREDTVVFPAWTASMPEEKLAEMSAKFEDIEHRQFGEDGFEHAVNQIDEVEQMLGFSDLAQFTAPQPGENADAPRTEKSPLPQPATQ